MKTVRIKPAPNPAVLYPWVYDTNLRTLQCIGAGDLHAKGGVRLMSNANNRSQRSMRRCDVVWLVKTKCRRAGRNVPVVFSKCYEPARPQ